MFLLKCPGSCSGRVLIHNMALRLTPPPPSPRLPGNQTPPSSSSFSVEQLMMMMSPASSEVLVLVGLPWRTSPSAGDAAASGASVFSSPTG